MKVLFWYCEKFAWNPTMKTLEDANEAIPETHDNVVVAFIHVEPEDSAQGSSAETKLVKNAKWLARKWEVKNIILHSFSHLSDQKAEPEEAKRILDRAQERLEKAGYHAVQTPYGYFNDLEIKAPGHPLARIYKQL